MPLSFTKEWYGQDGYAGDHESHVPLCISQNQDRIFSDSIISAFPNFKKILKKNETPSLSGFVRSQQFYS
jgi:hypothetical protein